MPEGRRVASEEALIERYLAPLASGFAGAWGLKDDAASLRLAAGEELVLTTDAVAAGVHFFPDDSAADIAWKALAVNASDLIAKGARPTAYLLSLAFPEAPEEAWLERFAAGLAEVQAHFGMVLAGGDTDRRPSAPLSITVTALGTIPKGRMVRRATAQPGDLLFVSGTLGDSALGLRLRQETQLAAAWGLDSVQAEALVARYLRPDPPLKLADPLRNLASAAMDISDGLAKDLGRLARASGIRAFVRGADVPLSKAARRVLTADPGLFATIVTGGDDYQVLAAIPPGNGEGFRAAAAAAGVEVTAIGRLEEGSGFVIEDPTGRPLAIDSPGWEHF